MYVNDPSYIKPYFFSEIRASVNVGKVFSVLKYTYCLVHFIYDHIYVKIRFSP